MRNPLIPAILALLREYPGGISEFDLLKQLKTQHPELKRLAEDFNLALFRQHFLIMNGLYQLQASLWQEEQLGLTISASHIQLVQRADLELHNSTELNDSVDAKLAAYYLDWEEYVKTDEEEVERLLDSFFKGIVNADARKEALALLGIEDKAPSKDEIKRRYRKLAHDAHPDRGGDKETFISLRQAYECLIH
ncbi:molecular chaperone DnaJ [Maribrevibacterium harenarium]|uniref:Molecular chaperone DnaJ n=1 Tax=Maribrevibacterium harenarium TaxID=2589817 RepID=A0A501WZ02_9GAMM|nr:DNA-J related domain-containing protein [Maribrevibacterium harenarium]TPE54072.1 molecular chaperone DnaJ [Maribrevibacterium harenarium]